MSDPSNSSQDLWRILAEAVEANATSVSLEPGPKETVVRFRVDGQLRVHENLARSVWEQLVEQVQ